jgi:hypothetical protein
MSLSKLDLSLINGLNQVAGGKTFEWHQVVEKLVESEAKWPAALVQIQKNNSSLDPSMQPLLTSVKNNVDLLEDFMTSCNEKTAVLTPSLPTSSPTKVLKTLISLLKKALQKPVAAKSSSSGTIRPPSPAMSMEMNVISDDELTQDLTVNSQYKAIRTSTTRAPIQALIADVDSSEESTLSDEDDLHAGAAKLQSNISSVSCNIYSETNGTWYQYKFIDLGDK